MKIIITVDDEGILNFKLKRDIPFRSKFRLAKTFAADTQTQN